MINRQSMEGAVIADDFEEVIYKVDEEDLYMIGTAEHAIAAMHSKEIIEGKHDKLPEDAFMMVGTIDDAIKKAKTL